MKGLLGLADQATRFGGSPHLSCKRDQIKVRDYMDRRVTSQKRVTSPTWGPPSPCKQAVDLLLFRRSRCRRCRRRLSSPTWRCLSLPMKANTRLRPLNGALSQMSDSLD